MQRHRPDRKAKRQSWKRHAQIKFSTAADIQPASRCSHSDRPGLVFGPGLAREPARTRRPVLLTFALPAAGRLAFCFGAAALAGVEGALAGVDAFCRLLLRAGTGAGGFCARLLGGEDCASWRRKSCCWRMVCCCICCFCISSTDNMSWSGPGLSAGTAGFGAGALICATKTQQGNKTMCVTETSLTKLDVKATNCNKNQASSDTFRLSRQK